MTEQQVPKTYSSTFPADLPADLDDPATIAAHDQQAFQALDGLLRHWDRPHRTSYHWLLPIGEHPQAVDLAQRCQRHLPAEGLDPIPGKWLHLTIRRLGYHDEISSGVLSAAVDQAMAAVAKVEPFPLTLLPLAGSPGAVRLSVAPWTPLLELFASLPGRGEQPETAAADVYRPHVGIAYSAAQQSSQPISSSVGRAADSEGPLVVPVDEVLLVSMQRARSSYEWHELHRLRLGEDI